MGHLHLHVGDIDEGLAFYRDVLGFEVQANLGSAAFVCAGGYHHHLGFNVWRGPGVGPAPGAHRRPAPLDGRAADGRGRRAVRARVADADDIAGGFLVRDPWGTAVAFVAAGYRARRRRTCRSAGGRRRGSPC